MSASIVKTGGKILNRVAGDVGDADTSYIYFLCKMGEDKTIKSLKWTITATTITLEFSNDDVPAGTHFMKASAAQMAALNWTDLTTELTGAGTQTTTGSHTFDTDFAWRYGRVKALTTNATNALALYLNRG